MPMKTLFPAILIFFQSLFAFGSILSTESEFSLITCSEGADVYSLFGHTAIRVKNDKTRQDVVFNYGIFDFNSKNFIYKFVKGETYYMLGVQRFDSFLFSYQLEERSVWEQKLHLTTEEKQQLITILATDYKPENRTYLYNFLYNNCATKVRDNLEKTLNISEYAEAEDAMTFREILMPYLSHSGWTRFGINIALGQPLEKKITQREKLFLPIELMDAYDLKGYETQTLYKAKTDQKSFQLFSPVNVFIPLLALLIFRYLKAGNLKKWPVISALFVTGLGGIVLTFISFFSIHPAVFPNFNLLIFQPLNLLLAIYLIFKQPGKRMLLLYMFYYTVSVLILMLVKQVTTPAIVMFSLIVLLLTATQFKAVYKKRAA